VTAELERRGDIDSSVMMMIKPVIVQITIVSRNTPMACTKPCSHGCSALDAAAAIVIVP
jgi:hypothetical protein